MLRRIFCKTALIAVAVCALLAFSSVLQAQGRSEEALEHVKAVQERNTERLMELGGVVGTAVGLDEGARYAVLVLTERPGLGGIPDELDGVPVQVKITGRINALIIDTTDRFVRPVPTGVSTGHPNVTAGTIACRVTDGTKVYALSNNHVYADENRASVGDNVLQPGVYDGGQNPGDAIGTLSAFKPIVFSRRARNEIDAAIALSSTSLLGNATPSPAEGGYGAPASTTIGAVLYQQVQKFGRTTLLTKGVVTGVNAIAYVGYDRGTARFVNQIIVESATKFIGGGDSGSLLVTDDPDLNPVGLLYAGNVAGTLAIANPIDLVLQYFGVSIDGGETPPPPTLTGSISGAVTSSTTGIGIPGATVSVDTGLSTTTDDSGTYNIADVPAGGHSVTASATGYMAQTQTCTVDQDKPTTVNLQLVPVGGTVRVTSIFYAVSKNRKHLSVTVALRYNLDPVGGALVSVTLTNDTTGGPWTATGTTGSSGTVTFTLNNAPSGTYTTEVMAVSAAGLTWDGVTPENSYYK